jgi:hypothetical protein
MAKRAVSKDFYNLSKSELNDLKTRYERGEVTDETLYSAENAFYSLEKAYLEQSKSIKDKFPDADREQWLFDYLCEMVGITRQDHGQYALPAHEVDRANRQIWKVIDELIKTWDKGDLYCPNPRNPDSRQWLVRDLRDKKRRNRARNRNLSDMEHGRPFRGPAALVTDPSPKSP